MTTFNIYDKALQILEDRENYHYNNTNKIKSYTAKQCELAKSGAYNSAWWILYYAIHGDLEALEQYNYYSKNEDITEEWTCTPETVARECEV